MTEHQSANSLREIRERAEHRGRVDHPEGARYSAPSWDDVEILLSARDYAHQHALGCDRALGALEEKYDELHTAAYDVFRQLKRDDDPWWDSNSGYDVLSIALGDLP